MDDVNKDSRDQGCGAKGQAQKSEVHGKEIGSWWSVVGRKRRVALNAKEASFPSAMSLLIDLHPHFLLPTPSSPRILQCQRGKCGCRAQEQRGFVGTLAMSRGTENNGPLKSDLDGIGDLTSQPRNKNARKRELLRSPSAAYSMFLEHQY